jgi:hypothetical protein
MRKLFRKNEKAQVLGLPMYLIIIMIVAVAVIAAVLFMLPRGSKSIQAVVTENFLISEDPGATGMGEYTFSSYSVSVLVTTNDENADPISSATVTLTGAGTSGSGTTDANGLVTISVTPTLEENEKDAYMQLEIKASGYDDYEKVQAVHVHREI